MELLDADWLSEGPIRLNETLSLSDLSGCLVLNHARGVASNSVVGDEPARKMPLPEIPQ